MSADQILHYRLQEKLGEGGVGSVHRAHDTRLDRAVALKFLDGAESSAATAALLQEARAAARLSHPNILTVFAVEEHEQRPFLVMEYVPGQNLRAWMEAPSFELTAAIGVTAQVADGLAAAHAEGIIHRDIKPENVHMGDDGRARLLDFGLARAVSGSSVQTGPLRGTAPYMSPEQILGQQVDHRSDIFSIGVLLYELVTGRRPFAGDYEPAVLYAILHADPEPPEDLNPLCSEELSRLIGQCLAKAPDDRIESCASLAAHLRELAAKEDRSSDPVTSQPPAIPPRVRSEPLVGREVEQGKISAHLERAARGQGYTVILSGEAGIGKSRLCADTMTRARAQGLSVFEGRCLPGEGGLPYHAVATALKRNFKQQDDRVLEGLAGRVRAQGLDLHARLPVLRAFLGLEPGGAALLNREQLWDAILQLLRAMATERPVLLVIDDLHWADAATLALVTFLARNLPELSILMICSWRTGEALSESGSETPAAQTLRQLRLERVVDSISLERLSPEQSESAIRQLLRSDPVESSWLEWMVENAAGNPLFVTELVAWVQRTGVPSASGDAGGVPQDLGGRLPERLRDLIGTRLETLESQDRELLSLASCEPDDFGSDALAACLGQTRLALLQRLQALEATHRLIRHDGTRYRFDHPLIRQVLRDALLPELRQEYHRMLADWLTEAGHGQTNESARIAHHLLASGQDARALPYLLEAGQRSWDMFAHHDATVFFRRAAAIAGASGLTDPKLRVALARGLGDVAASLGDSSAAIDHYRELLALGREVGDEGATLLALRRLCEQYRMKGDLDEAVRLGRSAIDSAPAHSVDRIEGLNVLAFVHAARGEYRETIQLSDEALTLADQTGNARHQSVRLSQIGHAYWHLGNFGEAVRHLDQAITMQREIGDRRGLATSLNFVSLAYWKTGELERALRSQAESLQVKEQIGDSRAVPGSLNALGDIYREIGDLAQAEYYHQKSLAMAREHGNRGSQCDSLRDLGLDHLRLGRLDSARAYLDEVLELATKHGYTWYETRAHTTRALLELEVADGEAATSSAAAALALAKRLDAQELLAEALWASARLKHAENDLDQAAELLEEAVEIAERIGFRTILWQLLHELACCQRDRGDIQDAEARDRAAHDVLQSVVLGFTDAQLRQTFVQSELVRQVLD